MNSADFNRDLRIGFNEVKNSADFNRDLRISGGRENVRRTNLLATSGFLVGGEMFE